MYNIMADKIPSELISLNDINIFNHLKNIDTNKEYTTCLIILNCKKYDYKRQYQRNSWLLDFPLKLWFHIQANPDQEMEYEIDEIDHLITVKTFDDYVSLSKKTFLGIKAIYERYNVDYIFKTDDDMNFDIHLYNKYLSFIYQYDYGGYLVNIEYDHLSNSHFRRMAHYEQKKEEICRACKYACGRFYFLKKWVIEDLLKNKYIFWNSTFEDNTVGYVVTKNANLKMLKLPEYSIFFEYDHENK